MGPSLLINADISPTNTMSSVGTFRLPFAFAHEVTFPSSRYDLTIGHTSPSYEANSSTSLYHQKCNSEAIASSSVFPYTDAWNNLSQGSPNTPSKAFRTSVLPPVSGTFFKRKHSLLGNFSPFEQCSP